MHSLFSSFKSGAYIRLIAFISISYLLKSRSCGIQDISGYLIPRGINFKEFDSSRPFLKFRGTW